MSDEQTIGERMNDEQTIDFILARPGTIAVVGLSPSPARTSHRVSLFMQSHGWRIVPVNPNAEEALGEKAYPSLAEAARHERIDIVNCFRKSEDIPPIVDDAIASGAKVLWMQLGITNEAAAARARAAGMTVVQDRCIKVEQAARL
ncbi:MAG: CoA-binding protein [Burkholderiales bacterium]